MHIGTEPCLVVETAQGFAGCRLLRNLRLRPPGYNKVTFFALSPRVALRVSSTCLAPATTVA